LNKPELNSKEILRGIPLLSELSIAQLREVAAKQKNEKVNQPQYGTIENPIKAMMTEHDVEALEDATFILTIIQPQL